MRAPWRATLILAAALGIGESVAGSRAAAGDDRARTGGEGALEHRLWGELIVRVPLSRGERDVLTGQVDRIWAPYGVALDWRMTPPPSPLPEAFSGWIRVLIDANATDHLRAGTRRQPAIAALHMPGGVPRNVIYVSLDGARTLLRRGSSGRLPHAVQHRLVARIAGRAIAHELGHYLLRTTEHAAEGLMRPEFTHADLLESDVARFRLTPLEAARLARQLFLEGERILAQDRPVRVR
jgi:hypothetical protein